MSASLLAPSLAELALMTDQELAARWRDVVGEPPAILLQDREEMARVLMESLEPFRSPPRSNVRSAPLTPSGKALG